MTRKTTCTTRQFHLHHMRTGAGVLFSALALLTAVLLASPAAAFGLGDGDNLVDPTQRADNSFIYDTTIESLTNQAALYNNRTVQVVGEVIGDRIFAHDRGYCWITLTVIDAEDKTSIAVLISDEQANQIDRYGRYGITGTILQVRGTYHQACSEHDGLPDIHTTDSAVMTRGVDHRDVFNLGDFTPGIIMLIVGIIIMTAFHFARERTR